MIKLKLVDDFIHLWCDYVDKTKCQVIGGGRWDGKHGFWEFPRESIVTISEVFKGEKVSAEPEVLTLLESLRYRETVLQSIKNKTLPLDDHSFLMYHQKQCKEIARYYDKFALFLDTGTGKTIAASEIIQDKAVKSIVVCPKSIIKSAWVEDVAKFYPDMRLLPLSRNMKKEEYVTLFDRWGMKLPQGVRTSKDNLKELLAMNAQTYIINPESFKADIKEINTYDINMLIIDESVTIKNPQSQITKEITTFADSMNYVYILSGKPAPNSQMDYFAQMRIVDPSVLGSSFFSFRQRYFHPVGYMGYNWELNEGAEQVIAERISKKAIFIRKEDCLDLPEKTYLRHFVELTPPIRKIYDMMEKAQLAVLSEGAEAILAPNKIAALMKLRQISSGFLINGDTVEPIHDLKITVLLEVLDSLGDRPVIIWAQFKHEIQSIEKALLEKGKTVVTAYSETKDTDESVRKFKHGEVQYMVAHPKTLRFGVTFVLYCSYAIYYSKSYDYDEYYQSHDRIYRKGQFNPCTFLDILVEDTIDVDIDKAVKNKGTVSDIIEGIVRRNL